MKRKQPLRVPQYKLEIATRRLCALSAMNEERKFNLLMAMVIADQTTEEWKEKQC